MLTWLVCTLECVSAMCKSVIHAKCVKFDHTVNKQICDNVYVCQTVTVSVHMSVPDYVSVSANQHIILSATVFI